MIMKKSLFLLFIIFSINFTSFSQPKGITQIIINTDRMASDNYKFCLNKLNELNIFASKTDTVQYVIKTDLLITRKRNYNYFLTFFCKDNQIVVSGKYKLGMSFSMYTGGLGASLEDSFEPVINKGMKGSANIIVFDEMMDIADQINGGPVYDRPAPKKYNRLDDPIYN